MPPHPTILIVGASTRAAASSALRAGLRPRCLDLFADADLAARCPVDRFDPERDADDLERLASSPACVAWLYTGTLETRPDLVARLSRVAPLLGNGPDVLHAIRDPWAVADALVAEGLPTPALRRGSEGVPSTGRWLVKSTATAGGLGVRWAVPFGTASTTAFPPGGGRWPAGPDEGGEASRPSEFDRALQRPTACPPHRNPQLPASVPPSSDPFGVCLPPPGGKTSLDQTRPGADASTSAYLQEFADGPSFSALFVAARGEARLIGVARQFAGAAGTPFLYSGGVAPWPIPDRARDDLRRVGETLARWFGAVGLFGVDFILAEGRPWIVEVNPRYTASVELFEYAMRRPLLRDHVRACVDGEIGREDESPRSRPVVVGKRVVYADRRLTFPEIAPPPAGKDEFRPPPFADVPLPGTTIEVGEPILTVLARGATPERCVARLNRRAAAWRARLTP